MGPIFKRAWLASRPLEGLWWLVSAALSPQCAQTTPTPCPKTEKVGLVLFAGRKRFPSSDSEFPTPLAVGLQKSMGKNESKFNFLAADFGTPKAPKAQPWRNKGPSGAESELGRAFKDVLRAKTKRADPQGRP